MPIGRRRLAEGVAVVAVALPLALGSSPPAPASVQPCSNGLVALTFDDGPATNVTPALIDELSSRKVPATFFVVGERVTAAPGIVRTAHRLGFQIANHTYGHEQLTSLSDAGIASTLRRTRRAVRDAGARISNLMRPPYGLIDSRVRNVVEDLGLRPVMWDIDPRDWTAVSSKEIAERVLRDLRPDRRNIVLLHDGVGNSPNTLRAVPLIVRGARERGYCFADLGPAGNPVPPVPTASVSDAVVTERTGDPARMTFTVTLDRPTSRATSVRVGSRDGTAKAGSDYRAMDVRLRFPVGVTRRTVSVRIAGDRLDEPTERLRLRLSGARKMRLGDSVGVGTIRDDDPPPRLRVSDAGMSEPVEGSARVTVDLTLSRPSGRWVKVGVATREGTAGSADFEHVEVTRIFAPGQVQKSVRVEILGDALVEDAEYFEVHVLSTRHATVKDGVGTVTIEDSPPSG